MVYMALELEYENPDSSLKLAHKIISESKKINYKRGVAYGLTRIGSIKNRIGEMF